MPGANFPRIKNWVEEILTYEDLNREIDNILENFNTDGMAGYSMNQAQMQEQTDPGGVGSESLATSLSGEIERLRFVIARIVDNDPGTLWYQEPARSLDELNEIIDTVTSSNSRNRIASGQTTGNSGQLNALDPAGTGTSVTLDATPTPFVYYINGTQYTVSADVSISGLTTAPATNNTALVNSTALTGAQATKWLGQFGTTIPIDTAGSQITARIGQTAAFKKGNEIFTAFIKSATELTGAQRGFFYNSSLAPLPAEVLSDDDVLTLMRLTWIFINTAGTLQVTYNPPIVSAEQPGTAAAGDFWYDLIADAWKLYNGTGWSVAAVLPIGYAVQDATDTIAARTFEAFRQFSALNTMILQYLDANTTATRDTGMQVSVNGQTFAYSSTKLVWTMPGDLVSGETEQANTTYWLYVTDSGDAKITAVAPVWRNSMLGYYHPQETWRAVGSIVNGFGLDFTASTIANFQPFGIDQEQLQAASIPFGKLKSFYRNIIFSNFAHGPSTTWTVPASTTGAVRIDFRIVGGGGGGGAGYTNGGGGGGGGGGAIAVGYRVVSSGEVLTLSLGSGGTGGNSVGAGGTDGGLSSIKDSNNILLGNAPGGLGGGGGQAGAGGVGGIVQARGLRGTAGGSGGALHNAGVSGELSWLSLNETPSAGGTANGATGGGGGGGGDTMAKGGAGANGTTGGTANNGAVGSFGSGGGGGGPGTTGSAFGSGGAGGGGYIEISWFGE